METINKSQQTYTVPAHYKIVSAYFSDLCETIKDILIKRSVTQNVIKIETAINIIEKLNKELTICVKDLERFSKEISQLLANHDVQSNQIKKQIDILNAIIERIAMHREQAIGLMSSDDIIQFKHFLIVATDKMLRAIFDMMERFIYCVDNPTEAVKRYGSQEITLNCTIDLTEEAKLIQFPQSCKQITKVNSIGDYYRLSKPQNSCSGLRLALAFLLGYWAGDD